MTDFISKFTRVYEAFIRSAAEIVAYTLELVGILIIVIGSARAITLIIRSLKSKGHINIVLHLGKSLSLALEFKMGAEIINTVIVRNFKELAILAIVILIRALLAFIIHWEIKAERNINTNN